MKNESGFVSQAATLGKEIISVGEFLAMSGLVIPAYQRPYKWTSKNINQLFGDIATHRHKPSYRLGTIVLHREGDVLNIVDGQQRTITLMLTVKALTGLRLASLADEELRKQLANLAKGIIQSLFDSEISQTNIRNNYLEIARIVERPEFTEDLIACLLNRCQVVVFELDDISQAFQFFDSQNARGRDLEPHDLLKAYHLREFHDEDVAKANTVSQWESSNSDDLAALFAEYLYRMRNWSKGQPARYFGKDDVHLFKGVNIDTSAPYPYAAQLRMAHHFVDSYNRQFERKIDGRHMAFPFRIDQAMINGRRFFEMTAHYQQRIASIAGIGAKVAPAGSAGKIIQVLGSYQGRRRRGDGFVRGLFDCLLICYIDKFGEAELARAIEKIFIWAYTVRLEMEVVQIATVDNYVIENNLFRVLSDAIVPADFCNRDLRLVQRIQSTKTDKIVELFREMRYVA